LEAKGVLPWQLPMLEEGCSELRAQGVGG
jgi:hypothetical protein